MLAKFVVFDEVYNRWPARGRRRAGESFDLLVVDMTKPTEHALKDVYSYRMSEKEVVKYWGELKDKIIEVGINEIRNGERRALLRGSIVRVGERIAI